MSTPKTVKNFPRRFRFPLSCELVRVSLTPLQAAALFIDDMDFALRKRGAIGGARLCSEERSDAEPAAAGSNQPGRSVGQPAAAGLRHSRAPSDGSLGHPLSITPSGAALGNLVIDPLPGAEAIFGSHPLSVGGLKFYTRLMKPPIDLTKLQVLPLARRSSEARLEDILVEPDSALPVCSPANQTLIAHCVRQITQARKRQATVMLIYGAHLIKNGAAKILIRLLEKGWITHLATNGAGVIHDWEFAFQGLSTESVRKNVATGTFGAWEETGRNIHLALLGGALESRGFGGAVGKFACEDGITLPSAESLEAALRAEPSHPLAPARADLLQAMRAHKLASGRHEVRHPWKQTSVLAQSFRQKIPLTVHPGIGYDIISNHPMFNGAAIGRAADVDFRMFGGALEGLDDGVVLSIGSAIMGPQVFEKSLSCVNNLRLQSQREIVRGHGIYVVDLQDGGQWDWTQGEPPKSNPAYYLRFCKSYARMGGDMHYLQCDNVAFLHHLLHELEKAG